MGTGCGDWQFPSRGFGDKAGTDRNVRFSCARAPSVFFLCLAFLEQLVQSPNAHSLATRLEGGSTIPGPRVPSHSSKLGNIIRERRIACAT